MATFDYDVIIIDPITQEPQAHIDVEARSIDSGVAIDLQSTNIYGIASFNLGERASFHARTSLRPPLYQVSLPGGMGAGPYGYDYLVDKNWATVVADDPTASEGQTITTFHGFTFKVYSTLKGAIDDGVAAAPGTGRRFSIGIVPGTYNESLITLPSGSPALDGFFLHGFDFTDHENFGEVLIQPTVGHNLFEVGSNGVGFSAENIVFRSPTPFSVLKQTAGGGNFSACKFQNCDFRGDIVDVTISDWYFSDCRFARAGVDIPYLNTGGKIAPAGLDDLYIVDCQFNIDIDLETNSAFGMDELYIEGCTFQDCDIILGDINDVRIIGNAFTVGQGVRSDRIVIRPALFKLAHGITITGNNFTVAPQTNGQTIHVDALLTGVEIWAVTITANTFSSVFTFGSSADTCHIRLSGGSSKDIKSIIVANNTFGDTDQGISAIENPQSGIAGFTVIGTFVERSSFGPNTQMSIVEYLITDGLNNLFIPQSTDITGPPDSGALPITTLSIIGATSLIEIDLGSALDGAPLGPL